MEKIEANIVDVLGRKIFKGVVSFENGIIINLEERNDINSSVFILPGLINSHVHIESSMLTPLEFSRLAVRKGTVAVVSDPHEIANVLGKAGVEFMIENAKLSPMKFYFGAPSCVPATYFETSGFVLDSTDIDELLLRDNIYFLSEMMNFPGVIFEDKEVLDKIESAKKYGKPTDGHAPGLSGESLIKYADAGITTDHESSNVFEAEEKIKLGIKLQIREGSAAKNFDSLYTLIDKYPNDVMLCTDDSHPDDLIEKHIDELIRRGISKGVDFFNLISAATLNPVKHYNLNVGLLQQNDTADFIIVDNLSDFNVLETYINGQKVFANNTVNIKNIASLEINNFKRTSISVDDICIESKNNNSCRVIEAFDGELLTKEIVTEINEINGKLVSNIENDILKIVVVNRYDNSAKPSVGFIKGFGLKTGALAESIAHDSHNIISVGVDDESIVKAINEVIFHKGGIAAFNGKKTFSLPLNIAGLMTNQDGFEVAEIYKNLNSVAKEMGSVLKSPFMTLSFMALLVIPDLKLGDKGLFKINDYNFVDLFV
jgi:adenine deaminase